MGTKEYTGINKVQNQGCTFSLEFGKYTANEAPSGDVGWKPLNIAQLKSVFGKYE